MIGRQTGSRQSEHYENVAYTLLGTRDVSEEDEDYIKVNIVQYALKLIYYHSKAYIILPNHHDSW